MEVNKPYLERDLIQSVEYIITDDEVKITSLHTFFLNARLPERMDLDAKMKEVKKLKEELKKRNGKIKGYNAFVKHFKAHRSDLEAWLDERAETFEEIRQRALKIKERGIHVGTCDDEELTSLIRLSQSYAAMYRRDPEIERILETFAYISWKLMDDNSENIILKLNY